MNLKLTIPVTRAGPPQRMRDSSEPQSARQQRARERLQAQLKALSACVEQLEDDLEFEQPATALSPAVAVTFDGVLIFISHSSHDVGVAALLTELLCAAFNLPLHRIRCTSIDEHALAPGADIDEQIRRELGTSPAVIGLISPRSVASIYVAFGLGARWWQGKHFAPLLTPDASIDMLQGPLKGVHAVMAGNKVQVQRLLEDIAERIQVPLQPPSHYGRKLDALVAAMANPASTVGQQLVAARKLLSSEALELIREAVEAEGDVVCITYIGGGEIGIEGREAKAKDDRRAIATWKGALDELVELELLKGVGGGGTNFEPTRKAYELADTKGSPEPNQP